MLPSRESDAGALPSAGVVTWCPTCRSLHYVERGDELELEPCHDDECSARLCPTCTKFVCTCCGLAHCNDHRVRISDEELCRVCVRALVEDSVSEYRELAEAMGVA